MASGNWFWNPNDPTTSTQSIVIMIGAGFVLLALTLMLILFISRVRKSQRQNLSDNIRERAQGILNVLIVHETFGGQLPSSFDYRIEELKALAGTSSFNNNVIIQLLLQIKKNLTGSSSTLLRKVYDDLGLAKHSLRKLSGITWKEKALGIRELTEMHHTESTARIVKFLRSRNPVLREESFMAMVRLETEKPFWFLDEYDDEITPWMQLNIHAYLQKSDARNLPDFSRWFSHRNKFVKLFSIAMTAQFRQTGAAQKLVGLIHDNDRDISTAAIETLTTLEAFEFSAEIIKRLSTAPEEKVLIACIRALAKIGEPQTTIQALEKHLTNASYNVRYETALAIKAFGPERFNELKTLNQARHLKLDQLISHLEEPLLQ